MKRILIVLAVLVIISIACTGPEDEKYPPFRLGTVGPPRKADKTPGRAQYVRARNAYLKKKYEEAVEHLDRGESVIHKKAKENGTEPRENKFLADTLLLRSTTYSEMNRHEEAIKDARKITALYPKEKGGYCQLGWVNTRAGKYEAAAKAVIKALELDPDCVETRRLLKTIRRNLNKPKKEEEKKTAP
jgi:tetratricopeptide (TPR) repeat protein